MSIGHRTNRLKIKGSPSVEKLQNDRYKLTITCSVMNSREDWYSINKSKIFPEFGSLQSAQMSIDGLAPRTGEAYADMRLTTIESGNRSPRDGSDYIIILTYETLGSSFVQVKDDTIDLELNGLRRVRRTSIAQAGTDIPADDKDIGVDYIDHQIDAETAVRCFLSSYEINDTDSYREFSRIYIQAGTLSVSSQNLSEGIRQVVTTFLATEGSTTGPIIRKSEDNFEGLKTISVTTLQDRAGSSIISTDPKLVHSYEKLVDFKVPGQVSVGTESDSGAGMSVQHSFYDLKPPVTKKVSAKVNVFFQTESNVLATDFTYDSSQGLWNPTSWAEGKIGGLGCNFSLTSARPLSETRAFVGYTSVSPLTKSVSGGIKNNAKAIEGSFIAPNSSANITVSGGPGVPSGKYVLDVQINPAFEDVNGNIYFKKTIVTATI